MSEKRLGDQSALDRRTTYRFSILAARQARFLSQMYAQEFGLTLSQWKVLPIIGHCAPMSAKEVGERTSLEPEKVTRAVDRLVARGLVTRRADSEDRRRVVLSLAVRGKEVFRRSEEIRNAIEREFLDALQPREKEMFHSLLDKLEQRAVTMFDGKQSWQKFVDQTESSYTAAKTRNRRRTPRGREQTMR